MKTTKPTKKINVIAFGIIINSLMFISLIIDTDDSLNNNLATSESNIESSEITNYEYNSIFSPENFEYKVVYSNQLHKK